MLINKQCCDTFRRTIKGFSHTYTFLPNLSLILPQTPLPSRLPHKIEQSSLCYTVGPYWLSILNIAVCTCPSQILITSKRKMFLMIILAFDSRF